VIRTAFVCVGLLAGCSSLAAAGLQAGAARVDITPPTGFPMWGYGARHDQPSVGVLDPLRARALVLAAGDRPGPPGRPHPRPPPPTALGAPPGARPLFRAPPPPPPPPPPRAGHRPRPEDPPPPRGGGQVCRGPRPPRQGAAPPPRGGGGRGAPPYPDPPLEAG